MRNDIKGDRNPPLAQDRIQWGSRSEEGEAVALFFASGLAWYFDGDGESVNALTKYGWTGIHKFVEEYGTDQVVLQFGIYNSPSLPGIECVVDQVKAPTVFDQLGGFAGVREEEIEPVWPEAWLWINGDAWYFDEEGQPLPTLEELGWQGIHRYLERYDLGAFVFG